MKWRTDLLIPLQAITFVTMEIHINVRREHAYAQPSAKSERQAKRPSAHTKTHFSRMHAKLMLIMTTIEHWYMEIWYHSISLYAFLLHSQSHFPSLLLVGSLMRAHTHHILLVKLLNIYVRDKRNDKHAPSTKTSCLCTNVHCSSWLDCRQCVCVPQHGIGTIIIDNFSKLYVQCRGRVQFEWQKNL